MCKHSISIIFLFFMLISFNISAFASHATPANCKFSVTNGWTQTIQYSCSETIDLNGATIQFAVDNPSGLINLNSVWGFSNLSQYPINPVLTLNGNIVTLKLNFTGPVLLNTGQVTDFSYSTDNNVNVKTFSLFPAGSSGNASLNISLTTPKPSDVTNSQVLVHVKDAKNTDHPIYVSWGGSVILNNLLSGTSYVLSADPIQGQKNQYQFIFTPSAITLKSGINQVNMIATSTMPAKGVNGWPSYIAMGAVTDDTSSTTTSLQSRPIDAIFKYGGLGGNGDPGQIVYPIFDLETANQAATLTEFYHKNNIANQVKPVMVIYTAQMSGGTNFTDFGMTNLVMHYINLLMEGQKFQSYQTSNNPYPASVILNPDLLGMIQQENLLSSLNTAISQVSLKNALKTAICFITHTINTPYGENLNYEMLFQAIRSQTTDDWSAMNIWNQFSMQYYNDCTKSPVIPSNITIPTFTNDFPGWVQSTNWLLKQFAPNVTFGWQENLWGIGSANWVHQNVDSTILKSTIADPTAQTILESHVFSKPFSADFLVFDKYEMDSIPGATGIGYLFNARDWSNVLLYVKDISESLGTIPVMLW
ncbi:MAG: hypothetical protein JO131_05280, partial [Gammaproteobacteria bacterium]|nr:hypothetical protein [Gammaproteobacteria bacterium]